jgi:hypothetical protein
MLWIGVGIGGLLFSRHYSGAGADLLHAYGANVSFSFAAYFMLRFFNLPPRDNRIATAAYAFLAVSAQEIGQAWRLYPGVFDALDFLLNALGICLALGVDMVRLRKVV